MIRKSSGLIHWLEFELFAAFSSLQHAIFFRHGGCSQGVFASLNLSLTMGDDPEKVMQNIGMAKAALSIERLASAVQVHSDGIALIDSYNHHLIERHDALMTKEQGIGLKVCHADCQAAIIYDPVAHAVATVHCGWKGHVSEIFQKTIARMVRDFGSKRSNLHVAIGPSLGPQHAEFLHYKTEFPETFWQFRISDFHFDLWELARWQLEQAGILPHHLQIAKICTYESSEDCFSYRRNRRVTGAHGTIALLKNR